MHSVIYSYFFDRNLIIGLAVYPQPTRMNSMTVENLSEDEAWSYGVLAAVFRSENLEALDVSTMQQATTYDPNNEVGRRHRMEFRKGLPGSLTSDEVSTLSQRVGRLHRESEQADSRAQIRFLGWLADGSDAETAKSAQQTLAQGLGLRGKAGALLVHWNRFKSW
jgi:hypothetical protein